MDRLNKGQLREFTAIYHDVFTRARIDPKDNLSEIRITHLDSVAGEAIDLDWTPMTRELTGYFTYLLTMDDRFTIGTQYNVYYRAMHPVDSSDSQGMEQFIVIDDVALVEGMLMTASFCNVRGGLGWTCK